MASQIQLAIRTLSTQIQAAQAESMRLEGERGTLVNRLALSPGDPELRGQLDAVRAELKATVESLEDFQAGLALAESQFAEESTAAEEAARQARTKEADALLVKVMKQTAAVEKDVVDLVAKMVSLRDLHQQLWRAAWHAGFPGQADGIDLRAVGIPLAGLLLKTDLYAQLGPITVHPTAYGDPSEMTAMDIARRQAGALQNWLDSQQIKS